MNILEEILIDKSTESNLDIIIKFLGYLTGSLIIPFVIGILTYL
jgi:hypothetical protein